MDGESKTVTQKIQYKGAGTKTPEIDGYSSDMATVKSYDYDHETKDKTITVSYKEVPPVVKEVKKVVKNILPQTGTEAEIGLAFTGAALVLIAGALYVKSKLRKESRKNDD